ncbi:MerR family transcriptional regulator [Dactylosporangium sp. AC04546]|uniref:MerR family transcriptional regulator n=1 Tax=Dactylosporangium sp. AC04546 TaxID=2862460 RepID=UPI001EDF4AAF|nr:MerR family transcriptional regulator [Dactylosporangium sp. AC04546]WVK89195.1 MerR family transcriptional regulator [Dactylosporangium sp. AC04546]
MRIGELAAETGTTTRALRLYEAEGLLASDRGPNGYRDYPAGAALRVRNIRELLSLGFTIADVRWFTRYLDQELPPAFADGGSCATAMRVAGERLADLRARIDALTRLHDVLAARMG